MRKLLLMAALGATLMLGALGLAGCASGSEAGSTSSDGGTAATSPSGDVSVYSREDGSGTRGAFIELFGIEEKTSSGEKMDMTTMSASITNSTSVMMTSVSGDESGIGYLSLGSLNDTVKALSIDGARPTAENVKSGEYKIARPFNIATKDNLSEEAQDFIAYIMSTDGQAIVEESGYISAAEKAEAYQPSNASGKVVVAGSSSVAPVMEKLAEAYEGINSGVNIEVQVSDSTTGVNMATEGTCDIGMVSRELKDSESAVTPTVIAQDGIAVIVNNAASFDGLTSAQVKGIFTGELATWEDALA